ncbi:hypothetical protein MIMGU_mgv1a000960mg [Erythranthe guttata]|uniref:Uncharacterized protein n=1 Tax=Erythranthe guttata TaxID=4155 RepID=A0A022QXJ2_ERYGU|nr:hypothetical protein MIMGU_mgv1a000960mg [Erythranthe guttata]
MKICCFPFLCFGIGEEDNNICSGRDTCYLLCSSEGKESTREGILGNESEEMEQDDLNLRGAERKELGLQALDGSAGAKNKIFDFDDDKSKDLLRWIKTDVESRHDAAGGSGSRGVEVDANVEVDVNLNLGLGGEPSSSSTTAVATERDNGDRDMQNKRPKVHSFSL